MEQERKWETNQDMFVVQICKLYSFELLNDYLLLAKRALFCLVSVHMQIFPVIYHLY